MEEGFFIFRVLITQPVFATFILILGDLHHTQLCFSFSSDDDATGNPLTIQTSCHRLSVASLQDVRAMILALQRLFGPGLSFAAFQHSTGYRNPDGSTRPVIVLVQPVEPGHVPLKDSCPGSDTTDADPITILSPYASCNPSSVPHVANPTLWLVHADSPRSLGCGGGASFYSW